MKIILIVEDTEDDVFFLMRALKTVKTPHRTQVVTDGRQALEYMAGTGLYGDRSLYPLPHLLLLDLNLPYVPGLEVLKKIRQNKRHDNVTVAILTSSLHDDDMSESIRLGANHYLVKPPDPVKLAGILESPMGAPPNRIIKS